MKDFTLNCTTLFDTYSDPGQRESTAAAHACLDPGYARRDPGGIAGTRPDVRPGRRRIRRRARTPHQSGGTRGRGVADPVARVALKSSPQPAGADMVRVECGGEEIEELVTQGAYLLVWWRVRSPVDWPRITAFRLAGAWVRP